MTEQFTGLADQILGAPPRDVPDGAERTDNVQPKRSRHATPLDEAVAQCHRVEAAFGRLTAMVEKLHEAPEIMETIEAVDDSLRSLGTTLYQHARAQHRRREPR